MKRDLDLMRQILLIREASDKYKVEDFEIAKQLDRDLIEVAYNTLLLNDSGYLECDVVNRIYDSETGRKLYDSCTIYRITNQGHDYLDAVRDESIYKETKNKIGTILTSVPLQIIEQVATSIILKKLGI